MMDMQMLGMMNYILSIMRWQNAGRTASGNATGNRQNVVTGRSFEETLRQQQVKSVRDDVYSQIHTNVDASSTDSLRSLMMEMQNPYRNLELLGMFSGE